MRLEDSLLLAPRGHFLLKVYRGLELIDVMDEPNPIVGASRETHARLVGGSVANRSVSQIAFGTSGTAPADGNTAITAPFTKALDQVTYPVAGQVSFAFSLAAAENNGMAIREFGLLTAGGVLYARKVRATALNKESDLSFSGSWTITFP